MIQDWILLRRGEDDENQKASLNDPLKVSIVLFTRSKANKIKKTMSYFKYLGQVKHQDYNKEWSDFS